MITTRFNDLAKLAASIYLLLASLHSIAEAQSSRGSSEKLNKSIERTDTDLHLEEDSFITTTAGLKVRAIRLDKLTKPTTNPVEKSSSNRIIPTRQTINSGSESHHTNVEMLDHSPSKAVATSKFKRGEANKQPRTLDSLETRHDLVENRLAEGVSLLPLGNWRIVGPGMICSDDRVSKYSIEKNISEEVRVDSVRWHVDGGQIVGSNTDDVLQVTWGNASQGRIVLTVFETLQEKSFFTRDVTIGSGSATTKIQGAIVGCVGSSYEYSMPEGWQSYSWTVLGGEIASGRGGSRVQVTWSNSGRQSIRCEATKASCSLIGVQFVSVHSLNALSISSNGNECAGNIVTYSVPTGFDIYRWNAVGGIIKQGQGTRVANIQWSSDQEGTVTVSLSKSDCEGVVERKVDLRKLQPVELGGDTKVCDGGISAYTAMISSSGENVSYSWVVTGGTILRGQATNQIQVQWKSSQNGAVFVECSQVGKCPTSDVKRIEIANSPFRSLAIVGQAECCLHATTSYSISATNSSIHWSVQGGTIISGENNATVVVRWTSPKDAKIQVALVTSEKCRFEFSKDVKVQSSTLDHFNIVGERAVCKNSQVYYSTSTPIAQPVWRIENGVIVNGQGTNTINVMWSSSETGKVSLTGKSKNGCTVEVVKSIDLVSRPNPTIAFVPSPNPFECAENICTYRATSGFENYNWILFGGVIVSGQGTPLIQVQWSNEGEGLIRLEAFNGEQCKGVTDRTVTIGKPPGGRSSFLKGPTEVGVTDSHVFSTDSLSSEYDWSVQGGIVLSGNGTRTVTVKFDTLRSGAVNTAEVVVQIGNSGSCQRTLSKNCVVFGAPETGVDGGGSRTVCTGNVELFTTSAKFARYKWIVSGGFPTVIGNDTSDSFTVVFGQAGQANVTLQLTTEIGFTNSSDIGVTVHKSPDSILTEPIAAYARHPNRYSTTTGLTSYHWLPEGGEVLSGQGSPSAEISWDDAGIHQLHLVSVNASGCAKIEKREITTYPYPQAVISFESQIVCEATPFALRSDWSVPRTGLDFHWITPTADYSSREVLVQQNSGTVPYYLIVTDQFGTQDTAREDIEAVAPIPFTISGPSTVNCPTEAVDYSISNPGHYYWSVVGGSVETGQGSDAVKILFEGNGQKTIRATKQSPCAEEAEILTTVSCLSRLVATGGVSSEFTISPNPTSGKCQVMIPNCAEEGSLSISISSSTGREVANWIQHQMPKDNGMVTLDLTRESAGLYLVSITLPNNSRFRGQVLKF